MAVAGGLGKVSTVGSELHYFVQYLMYWWRGQTCQCMVGLKNRWRPKVDGTVGRDRRRQSRVMAPNVTLRGACAHACTYEGTVLHTYFVLYTRAAAADADADASGLVALYASLRFCSGHECVLLPDGHCMR